jgi:hypothetical protein
VAIYPQFVQSWIPTPDPQGDTGAATVHVTVAAGDTLLILGSTAASTTTLSAPTGGGLTYTLQAQTPVTSGYDNQYEWTATSATAQTFTLSVTASGSSNDWGFIVQRWANVGAIGSVAKNTGSSSAPSLSLTTTQAYSAIVFAASDYNGGDGSGRVWNTSSAGTLTEDHYDRDPTLITNYIGHYNNPGAAGAKTVGLTSPSMKWSATAIELVGLSATPYTQNPADTTSFTDSIGTLVNGSLVPADQAAVSDAVANSLGHFIAPADTSALSDAATAVRDNRSADTAALTDAVTIIQTRSLLLSEVFSITDSGGLGTNPNTDPNIGRLPNGSIPILTRPDITNYQFMVDTAPWCPFGEGEAVNVAKFTPGGSSVRVQDVPGGTADNVWFGVDYHTPGAWTWDLFTDAGTDPGLALSWVDVLDQVWNDPVRLTPNGALPLRYCVAGRIRRVYGRPRRWTPIHDMVHHGKVKITCDFQLSEDETYYDDVEQSATVGFAPAVISGTYWKFPITFPLAVQTPGAIRSEQITIGGTQSTWVIPTFHGPVSNPWVQFDLSTGGSFRWALNGTLSAGTSMTLSGRPWDTGVLAGDGTYHPEMLDPRARLSQLRLKPGTYSVSFGGLDVTSTATVSVRWRNAYRSL